MQQEQAKVYFPSLDGWRFVWFIVIFLMHCFHVEYAWQKETVLYKFIREKLLPNGDMGLSFFFVLSGFLITYLLLKEEQVTGKIHLKAFYIRRALRIWPLYYFCLFFGFVIFPWLKEMAGMVPNETANPWMYIFYLGNFDLINRGLPDSSVLGVLWSVCVEEQFYLVWPLLLTLAKPRHYPKVFGFVIGGSLLYRAFHYGYPDKELNTFCIISDMAIGGLSAWLVLNSPSFVRWIRELKRPALLAVYGGIGFMFFFKHLIFIGPAAIPERIITGILFSLILLEQNFCRNSFFRMENYKVLNWLGKYSYGMYCLHFIALLIQIRIGNYFGFTSQWWVLLFGPMLGLLLAIVIALLSYHLYEVRFLNLKKRFTYVARGDEASVSG